MQVFTSETMIQSAKSSDVDVLIQSKKIYESFMLTVSGSFSDLSVNQNIAKRQKCHYLKEFKDTVVRRSKIIFNLTILVKKVVISYSTYQLFYCSLLSNCC